MKVMNTILKIVAVIAAIAGIAFVVIKFGDKIVAWTKDTWNTCKKKYGDWFCPCCDEELDVLDVDETDFEVE